MQRLSYQMILLFSISLFQKLSGKLLHSAAYLSTEQTQRKNDEWEMNIQKQFSSQSRNAYLNIIKTNRIDRVVQHLHLNLSLNVPLESHGGISFPYPVSKRTSANFWTMSAVFAARLSYIRAQINANFHSIMQSSKSLLQRILIG